MKLTSTNIFSVVSILALVSLVWMMAFSAFPAATKTTPATNTPLWSYADEQILTAVVAAATATRAAKTQILLDTTLTMTALPENLRNATESARLTLTINAVSHLNETAIAYQTALVDHHATLTALAPIETLDPISRTATTFYSYPAIGDFLLRNWHQGQSLRITRLTQLYQLSDSLLFPIGNTPVPANTQARIIANDQGAYRAYLNELPWWHIELPNIGTGWISQDNLEAVE